MSSLITAVFKATIGLLVNKGRDVATERLKEGDVTDQKFRGLIVREIDDIKSKLDGLARKDLLASISFFKEGIELLYVVFDQARSRSETCALTAQGAAGTTIAESICLAKEIRKLDLTGLDGSATRALANAKKRFERAREKATEAFANEALELSDRILAMQYRVMATILETVDNPTDAFPACRVCIEELHHLSAVKGCFTVELKKGFWARFSKDQRRSIISSICHVNRAIYDVKLLVCFGNKELSANWPCVDTGEALVDPLRDKRVATVLKKQGMEHCCVPWSFGQEGEEEHKLKGPFGITTNTHGQFVITDISLTVKMFDSNGNFLRSFNPQTDDPNTELLIFDVATDIENNIYVLVCLCSVTCSVGKRSLEVQVNDKAADLRLKFPVRGPGRFGRLTVSGSKVLVLGKNAVDMYECDGRFVCSFAEGLFIRATDIAAARDGRIMVLDCSNSCVHLFTVEGQQLSKLNVINIGEDCYCRIANHPAGEHVVVAGIEPGTDRLKVAIYTTNGEFVRMIQLEEEKISLLGDITVTMEGNIAVAFRDVHDNYKVIVV